MTIAASILKVAAQNIYATVQDTDDLSTIRGSSLTLAEMPRLVLAELARTGGVKLLVIQSAASELVVALTAERKGSGVKSARLDKKDMPATGSLKAVERACEAVKETVKTAVKAEGAPALAMAAAQICRETGLPDAMAGKVAGHFLTILGQEVRGLLGGGAVALTAAEMDKIAADLRIFLTKEQSGWPLDLFHFAVAWRNTDTGPFADTLGRIDSDLRRQQLKKLDCAAPQDGEAGGALCALGGVQPASGNKDHVKKGSPVSLSVFRRRERGLKAKQHLYGRVLTDALARLEGASDELRALLPVDTEKVIKRGQDHLAIALAGGFASDFSEIVADGPKGVSKSVLANFAIVYMDGNRFGQIRNSVIENKGADGLVQFSTWLEIRKGRFLANVLDWIVCNRSEMITASNLARFETLLWGGDEYEMVVPSWAAWSFAEMLSRELSGWKVPGQKEPLTFACGMAVAKSKSPIRHSSVAARELGELAKPGKDQIASNRLEICIYEGIDSLTMGPVECRAKVFGLDPRAYAGELGISLSKMAGALGDYAKVRAGYGRSGLMRLLSMPDLTEQTLADHEKRVGDGSNMAQFSALEGQTGGRLLGLRQGVLLWDYARQMNGGDVGLPV